MLVFLDSHEIKAYIDPDAPGNLKGFKMLCEDEFGDEARHTTVNLRHNQILNGLLFDPSQICGIIPSHAEEMDREIAFRFHLLLDNILDLVQQARQEISKNKDRMEQFADVAKHGTEERKRELRLAVVSFFQTHAPTLTAIMRDSLFSPQRRLKAILNDSQLTLFEDIPWSSLGVEEKISKKLRHVRPSVATIADAKRNLEAFTYRKNTVEANIADATALSYIELLRKRLLDNGIDNIRVFLVSRARSLLRAAVEMQSNYSDDLLVRHPRMLALTTADAAKLDDATELALGTALDVWRGEVKSRLRTAVGDIGEVRVLEKPCKAFLETWDTFEGSRLAVEMKWRKGTETKSEVLSERDLAELLITLFCSDANAEKALNQSLIERFNEFGSASSRFLLDDLQLSLQARVTKVSTGCRCYIAPLAIGAVGPIQVAQFDNRERGSEDLSLDRIASLVRNGSERPLVWSLMLACAGRWKQAAIFARSALQLAQLERDSETEDEARLLRAEIARLGSNADQLDDPVDYWSDSKERYEWCIRELSKVSQVNKERRLREQAAQFLDAALAGVDFPELSNMLGQYFSALDQSADEVSDDESKARCLALQQMLFLYDTTHHVESLNTYQEERASIRHLDLVKTLQRLQERGQTDVLPHRARAMEVIGYVLFGTDQGIERATPPIKTQRRPSNIPQHLHRELLDLLKGLEASTDFIAQFLRDEISEIYEGLRRFHNPELSLAPISIPSSIIEEIELLYPDLATRAIPALRSNEDVGWKLLKAAPQVEHEGVIENVIRTLSFAIEEGREIELRPSLMFHIKLSYLYAKLLDATLEPNYVRPERFRQLVQEYEEICVDYPYASLPRLRLSYLARELRDDDLEKRAISDALRLVDDDKLYPNRSGGPHWLQSFIRRRHALIMLRGHPEASRRWVGHAATPEASLQLSALEEACRTLLDAEIIDTATDVDPAHVVERKRRTNNIVFYASRLIERPSGQGVFGRLSPDKPLESFVERLSYDMEVAPEVYMLHTLGCYYAAVGDVDKARGAAQRIFGRMSEGEYMIGVDPEESYQEVIDWFRGE
ncbi:hypothetical protein ACMDCR_24870 [Labrys okinawensis]|uniref:hypothetical protein n=1 Tax=Labrys okinawensis TaxID=346911 RepID=UPI0039BD279D